MASDTTVILSWLADLAAAVVTDSEDAADLSQRNAAAAKLPAADFASEALSMMRVVAESVTDSAGFDRLSIASTVEAGDTRDAMSVMLAMALAVAGGRVDWPSRRQARAARARVSACGDTGLAVASAMGGDGADLYGWLSSVVMISCRLISDVAANAVPIVSVSTGISLPSTVLAYRLYGDAARAQSLVDIAGSATPMLMPSTFEALMS